MNYTAEEKKQMATEIKQRMYALFAVLGIAIFFWFSFHQNGTSLSLFARDFVKTDSVQPEIWQALNPFFVIVLTPVVMWVFSSLSRRGKEISTPRKIAIGMGLAGLAYLFLAVFSLLEGYPSAETFKSLAPAVAEGMKTGPWVLFVLYFFLTVAEPLHLPARSLIRIKSCSQTPSRSMPGSMARCDSRRQPPSLDRSVDLQRLPHLGGMDSVPVGMSRINGYNVLNGGMA